ncbi:polyprenyl synthetase family protein [Tenacibaculum finnmarkense]|uniref:polyprenyl synthetase family protein n=1 Tax=Tenacibaculum finnmarkense TaxID=2781243 RepID=UPI00187B735F|nr:polyprenyl synthetase family protein [Tenacibaculum finnmarkense]MBE7659014.1 polyprenyl synthetase family protein [Tenacibaculum finnmarkense genomovar finnmarkense]MCG8251105.1 polyprenyl synthetase family protein [Tenacibaculum finnmarkense genomovar finnmarkense]MCG8814216.1 polyprenyl synthetase family protein [Tenacibaculum finnmarkense]MCG8819241.1 polyprenyl synthetase family protein [Tenacibaculum finnmarkense]
MDILQYQSDFLAYLASKKTLKEPKNLYEPIDYILQIGGKRIRPMLTLMASDIFSGDYKKAMPAALAVEVFHNFTLVHDDIMDDAPLRRGHETVHEKWDINRGILSGDAMLILAYQYFENYEPIIFQKLAQLFSKTALEVCDGQQLDVDFETRNDVTIAQYIKMITLKTSVLVAAALKMGAIVANANEEQAQHLYNYGLHLGVAFQLQDDYLDTYGDPETFGKQVGGDIIENKKTYLYLKAFEVANTDDKEKLTTLYNNKQENIQENIQAKIATVSAIFTKNNIPEYTHQLIEYYTNKSFESLAHLNISDTAKSGLRLFAENLMSRKV